MNISFLILNKVQHLGATACMTPEVSEDSLSQNKEHQLSRQEALSGGPLLRNQVTLRLFLGPIEPGFLIYSN